jgi:anti-sigma-K factor RskA
VTTEHDILRDNAGPWVLGALDGDEAWQFSAHLEVCAACRREVQELSAAADVLPLSAPPVEPPPALKQRLMAIVEAEAAERAPAASERRGLSVPSWLRAVQLRPALAAGLAGALILGGVAGFAARGGGSAPAARTLSASVAIPSAPGARATLVRTGDQAQLRVSHFPQAGRGRVYEVWVKRPGRAPQPDALFAVNRSGRGAAAVVANVDGAEAVLVTSEPDGGSLQPSSAPVVMAKPS